MKSIALWAVLMRYLLNERGEEEWERKEGGCGEGGRKGGIEGGREKRNQTILIGHHCKH